MKNKALIFNKSEKTRICLSCGIVPLTKQKKKFHSEKCGRRLKFYLDLFKPFLQGFYARYAIVTFTTSQIIIDVLPHGSKTISRFIDNRDKNEAYTDSFKRLMFFIGKRWDAIKKKYHSESRASRIILTEYQNPNLSVEIMLSQIKELPKLSKKETKAMQMLSLTKEQLISENKEQEIKAGYRKTAWKYHPDLGGNNEEMIRVNQAVEILFKLAKFPKRTTQYFNTSVNSWLYDGSRNKWISSL